MQRTIARLAILAVFSGFLIFCGLTLFNSGAAQSSERIVKITAHKFEYEPSDIHLKLGEPVVLELTSKDVTHGFNIPDFGLRADLEPGETVRVRLVPEKAGSFEFHCDNFCGLNHESMSATITVQ